MPWITTKTGKRVNTDWFDEERKKQAQIDRNKAQANQASGKSHKQQIHELMGNDSYVNSPEYMSAMKQWQELEKQRQTDMDRRLELYKVRGTGTQINKDDLEAFGGDRNLAALFATKSPEAEAADKELKEIYRREKELDRKQEHYQKTLEKHDKEAAKKQKTQFDEDFKAGKLTMRRQSREEYEGFETDTHTTHYQDLYKKGEAMIMDMSPKEYLQRCAVDIFDSTFERQVRAAEADADHTFELVEMMRSGTKMYMPVLNYNDKEQEGRHRAVAAMLLGIDRIPVMVVPKKRR